MPPSPVPKITTNNNKRVLKAKGKKALSDFKGDDLSEDSPTIPRVQMDFKRSPDTKKVKKGKDGHEQKRIRGSGLPKDDEMPVLPSIPLSNQDINMAIESFNYLLPHAEGTANPNYKYDMANSNLASQFIYNDFSNHYQNMTQITHHIQNTNFMNAFSPSNTMQNTH